MAVSSPSSFLTSPPPPHPTSPNKPRLLWRGELHLPDGTALPGIAFVSNAQPNFSSRLNSSEVSVSSSLLLQPLPPLTLASDQQDDLSLSIEMVRHAPINIIEVIEEVDRDEFGTMLRPKRLLSSIAKENNDQFRVSYEVSGGIRMYADPAYPSSVAYMERLFCYDDGDDDDEGSERAERHLIESGAFRSTSNVLVLSLNKSHRYNLKPLTDTIDVFSEKSLESSSSSLAHESATMGNEAATEAVIIGVKVQSKTGTSLELHVGQKVVRKKTSEGVCSLGSDQNQVSSFGMRPDDPAPRGLSRALSAKYPSTTQLTTKRSSSSLSLSSTKSFAAPHPRTSRDSFSGIKRPQISVLPYVGKDSRPTSMPNLKRESSTDQVALPAKENNKRSKTVSRTTTSDVVEEGDEKNRETEEKNRSLIKKLVHHQLLGKGVEKKDEDYLACFNSTCNGTVLALRRQIKTEIIEKAIAASIIEKHLYMYL
ncbi:hypothetical protein CBS101457_004472 [Exobasidium rhododendri]|nr:hypothetical protein CBS101457_004472 [Exobasidium rhododendri]